MLIETSLYLSVVSLTLLLKERKKPSRSVSLIVKFVVLVTFFVIYRKDLSFLLFIFVKKIRNILRTFNLHSNNLRDVH